MESYKIENLSFTYPGSEKKALDNVNISIKQGEFVCVLGKSGCGKTTLLRHLKAPLSHGDEVKGNVLFEGELLTESKASKLTGKIGFIMQNVESQIVCDRVWHEMAFGLESMGLSTQVIRARVAEMAAFFGIEHWFYKKTDELSGGQKQLLNLASVMVMRPEVLILDEPTSQLDPIAAGEFLNTLKRINSEFSTTIIISEHRLEEVLPISDKVLVMDEGKIIACGSAEHVAKELKEKNHDMYTALPTPMYVFGQVDNGEDVPKSCAQGRRWLKSFIKEKSLYPLPSKVKCESTEEISVELKDVWFRYDKNEPDILKGISLKVKKGEIFSVLGGNASGKTTMLSAIAGLNKPYRGGISIFSENLSQIENPWRGIIGMLPQNPIHLFSEKTVYDDLFGMLSQYKITDEEKNEKIQNVAKLCKVQSLLESHPYDLSGGEVQRAALCMLLILNPQIILLDEPTKGVDSYFKATFSNILKKLSESGKTIIMVSHDIEFCAEVSDRCALFFDGGIIAAGEPERFFTENTFYTTAAAKMARGIIEGAVLKDDIIRALGGTPKKRNEESEAFIPPHQEKTRKKEEKTASFSRIILGSIFSLLFLVITALQLSGNTVRNAAVMQFLSILMLFGGLCCFFPQKNTATSVAIIGKRRKPTKKAMLITAVSLILIPITIFCGIKFFDSRKYYFISLLIILETFIPFLSLFEGRRPRAGEVAIISVLCASAVCGRAAFFALQQFKPVVAIVIISGVCFGAEAGFLVGAVSGFVSNFFFGQGPWTPWQMFAFGIIGFVAGIVFGSGFLKKNRTTLCVFGFLATIILFGGITNPAAVLMWQEKPTWQMILASYAAGFPMDIIHGLSTAFFLWFIGETMIEKLERIKIKYRGMLK